MMDRITNHIQKRIVFYQSIFCAVFTAGVFSFRWANCLPFSGRMPVLGDGDKLELWARYILYVKEPLDYPLGVIKSLSFPFQTSNISHGPVELFAIIFKVLSKVYAPLSEFYYLVFIEILFVFLTGYFTVRIVHCFHVKSFSLKLLASVLVALSFPLLHRSSSYYGMTFEVAYVPLFTIGAYCLIRIHNRQDKISLFGFAAIFPVAALIDYYPLFGLAVISSIVILFSFVEFVILRERMVLRRLLFLSSGFALGMVISMVSPFILGYQGSLKTDSKEYTKVLTGRYRDGWGYGGGRMGSTKGLPTWAPQLPVSSARW